MLRMYEVRLMPHEAQGCALHEGGVLYHLVSATGQGREAAHDLQAHELRGEGVRSEAESGAKGIQCIVPCLDGGQNSLGFRG